MPARSVAEVLARMRRQANAAFLASVALTTAYWFLTALDLATGESPLLFLGQSVSIFLFVWLLRVEALQHGYWPAYHYGLGLLCFWPVLIPYHLWRAHRRRGIARFALLLLGLAAPYAGWAAGVALGSALGRY